VLPDAWPARLGARELESVLLHEVAHVRRGDLLGLATIAVLGAVWWWNPVFRVARARWRTLIEEGCDERAIAAAEGDPVPYCQALLRAARLMSEHVRPAGAVRPQVPAGAIGMSAHALEGRLRRAMTSPWPRGSLPGPIRWALVVAGLCLLPSWTSSALPTHRAAGPSSEHHRPHRHAHGHVFGH
jgi:beta-lactamase regulating signal transducer with metallopeptidase domain